ncbi:PD-(D/E)XK nuclease family protein [Alicyclobacillus sp. SO9]|uniref:PD-(D/E)XK nuclease family protein n=1 Tax=Alicyclobacillus sp. SO9 TaxID=2665646 RepID=UPI0018E72932|nr:PD-(D/E)XK nuclease family protein [Alicyclobacillus sp. SO9]
MKIPEWPHPSRLEKTSPAGFESLLSCPLKGFLDTVPSLPAHRVTHPKALIGIVCHDMLRRASVGAYDHIDPSEIKQVLREQFHQKCQHLLLSSVNASQSQRYGSPENWPGYNIRYYRLQASALQTFERRSTNTNRSDMSNVDILAERELKSSNGRLVGRPDRMIYREHGDAIIEDYKTGEIYDGNELRAHIRRQMLLYTFLCVESFDVHNVTFRVIPMNGVVYEENVDLAEAVRFGDSVFDTLDSINTSLLEISRGEKLFNELAQPSAESCAFCPYRNRCDTYWSSMTTSNGSFLDVEGRIDSVSSSSHYTEIRLTSTSSGQSFVISAPITFYDSHLEPSQRIRCIQLRKVGESSTDIFTEVYEDTTIWWSL